MVFLAGIVAALVVAFVVVRLLSRMSVKSAQLGVMSEQWLAEQRQSHSQ